MSVRVGAGFDVHAFDQRRPLIVGGVLIPGEPGLAGHSDADVLTHAITDALLGAARLGDLGALYPDTDEWRDASSLSILADAVMKTRDAGWRVVNVDSTIVAERPRMAPHKVAMADNLARTHEGGVHQFSIKATTSDGLGFTGRGEGIAAQAVVLIESGQK
jgi:2-C-methyl-D-erythritol 2,4-cyclodiphosphate synthase